MSEVMEPDVKAVNEQLFERFSEWAKAFGAEINETNFKEWLELEFD